MKSPASLVLPRAGELVDAALVVARGARPNLAERMVIRVLRARAVRRGNTVAYPSVAVLYVPAGAYGPASRARHAMAGRIAERLDPDQPPEVRLEIRAHAQGGRRMWVCAPFPGTTPVGRPRPTRVVAERLPATLALLPVGSRMPLPVPDGGVVLGRGGRGPGRLRDAQVSRQHARVQPARDGVLRCEDLKSRNGTWVDGVRVREAVDLIPGQRLRVGETEFEVVAMTADGTAR
jgi:hypothetical protein